VMTSLIPGIDEMKTAIEDYLEVTQQEKCFNLKELNIRITETIREILIGDKKKTYIIH